MKPLPHTLRIALISHSPDLAGAEKMLINLAELLQDLPQFSPVIFAPRLSEMSQLSQRATLSHLELIPYTQRGWYINIGLSNSAAATEQMAIMSHDAKKLATLFRNNRIDLVICNTLTSLVPHLAGALADLPVISWVHGILDSFLIPQFNDTFRLTMDRVALGLSQRAVCCSEYTARYYSPYVHNDKLHVIHNWTTEQSSEKTATEQVFTCLNTFDHHKGYDILAQATDQLKTDLPNLQVHCYGDGSTKQNIISLITRKHLNGHFKFHTRAIDVDTVYSTTYCVVQPSLIEPFGMTLIEAMSHGLPVIATRSGGPQEIVVNQKTGLLVDPGDATQLAEAIKKIATNKTMAESFGRAGHQRWKTHFSPQVAQTKFTSLLQRTYTEYTGLSDHQLLLLDLFMIGQQLEKFTAPCNFQFSQSSAPTLIASPPIKKQRTYLVRMKSGKLSAIDLLLATHQKQLQGKIILTIKNLTGKKIAVSTLSLEKIIDNGWATFSFSPIHTGSMYYFVELVVQYENAVESLSIYEHRSEYFLLRVIRKIISLHWRLIFDLHYE